MRKETKIYVGGSFDLFHFGHIELLRQAKKKADFVIVALNTDEFHKRYKGEYPILTLKERMQTVRGCKYVDLVDINNGDEDSSECILRHKPDYILHGNDWKGEKLLKQMGITHMFLDKNNIEMIYVPYTENISSTEIKKRIWNRQL